MKKKRPHVKTRTAVKPPASLFPGLLRAAVISLGCGMALLLIVCAALLCTDDPGGYASTAAQLILLPVSVLCGVLAAKQSPLGGLPSGLLGGAILCGMLFILGVGTPDASGSPPTLLAAPIRAGLCLLLSSIGGYCVTHQKPKTRRRHP